MAISGEALAALPADIDYNEEMAALDQDRFDNQYDEASSVPAVDPGAFVTAREAAGLLGVKPATFYTYVSRDEVRRVPAPEGSAGPRKLYLRADVERLKARAQARSGHRAVAEGALRWGQPVLDTEITLVAGERLFFRGVPLEQLLDDRAPGGFARAVALLWERDAVELRLGQALSAGACARTSSPLLRMQAAVLDAAADDPLRGLQSEDEDRTRAARMLGIIGGAAVGAGAEGALIEGQPFELALARAWGLDDDAAPAIAIALITSCDHGLNASTTACRVAASTGADLYACAIAGLAALTGPKHGGACDQVDAFLEEALALGDARAALVRRAQRSEAPPGLGHPLYPSGDPRARALMAAVAGAAASGEQAALQGMALSLAEEAAALGLPPPTLDFGLASLARTLGLPAGAAAALFAIGRSAGWMAHAFEQRAQGHLIRPRARYVGPPPRG
jgi:citrate synthase